eukprot:3792748-Rhodomonas_salina.4
MACEPEPDSESVLQQLAHRDRDCSGTARDGSVARSVTTHRDRHGDSDGGLRLGRHGASATRLSVSQCATLKALPDSDCSRDADT